MISKERLNKLFERINTYKELGEEEMRMGVDEIEAFVLLAREQLNHQCPPCYGRHSYDDEPSRWHD